MRFFFVAAAILVVLAVIFSAMNSQPVEINFFGPTYVASLVVVMLVTLVIGIVAGYLLSLPARVRRMRELSDCRKMLKELEKRHGVR